MEESSSQYWNNVLKSADLLLSLLTPYEDKEDIDLVQNVLPPLRQLVKKGSSYSIPKQVIPAQPKQEHNSTPRRHRVSYEQEKNWKRINNNNIHITLSSGRVVNCIVVNTPEGLEKVIESIKQAEYVTFDCEFMGLKNAIPELKLLQIAVSDICGYAIQVDILGRHILEQKLKPVMESKDVTWIGWALRSDMLSIEQFFGALKDTGILDLQKKLATYAVEELNLHAAMAKYASDWDGFQEFQRAKQYGETFWFSDDDCIWLLNPLPPRAIVYATFDVLSVHILHEKTRHLESRPEFSYPNSVTHNLSAKALTRWHNQRNKAAIQLPVASPRNTTRRSSNHRKDRKNEFVLPVPVPPEPETDDGYNDNDPRFTIDVQRAIDLSLKEQNKNDHASVIEYDDLIQNENGDRVVYDFPDDIGPVMLAESEDKTKSEEVIQTWGHKKFESPFLGDHLKMKQERFSRPRDKGTPTVSSASTTVHQELNWSALDEKQEYSWASEKENQGWTMNNLANPSWNSLADNTEPKKQGDSDELASRKPSDSPASWETSSEKSNNWRRSSIDKTSNASRWSKPSPSQPVDVKKPPPASNWKSANNWKNSVERTNWQSSSHSQQDEYKPTATASKPIPESEQPNKSQDSVSYSWKSLAQHNRLSPARNESASPNRMPAAIAASPKKSSNTADISTTHNYNNNSSTHNIPETNNNRRNNPASARSSPMTFNKTNSPVQSEKSDKGDDQQPRTSIIHGQTGAFTWYDDSGSKEMGPASWASFATSSNQKWNQGIDTQLDEIERAPKISNPNVSKQFNINVNPYDANMNAEVKDSWNVKEVLPDTMEMRMNQIPMRKVFTGPRVMNPNDSLSDDSEDEFNYSKKSTPKKAKASSSKKYVDDDNDDEVSMIGLKIKNFGKFEQQKTKEHTTINLPTFVDSVFISPEFNTEEINIHSVMETNHLNSIEIPTEPFTVAICYHFAESKATNHFLKAIQLFIKCSSDPVGDSYTIVLEKACFKDRSLKDTNFGRLLTDPSIQRVCWWPEVIEEQTYQKLGFCLGPTIDLNVKVNSDEDRPMYTFAQSIDTYLKDWPDLYQLHEAKSEYDNAVSSKKFSGTPWDNKRIKEGVLRYSALQGFGAYALHKATEDLDILEEDCLWRSTRYTSK